MKHLSDIAQTIQERGCLPIVLLTSKPGDARRFAYEHGDAVEVVCCVLRRWNLQRSGFRNGYGEA